MAMTVQYVSDASGHTTAVIIPIAEWNLIKSRHPDVDALEGTELPAWQKELIDQRLLSMKENPGNTSPLDVFTRELEDGLDDPY